MTLIESLTQNDHFAFNTGARLTEIRPGYARAELTVTEEHLNAAHVCQGGVLFTLADLAFAGASNSHGILSLGISNTVTYVKSARLGERVIAECTELLDHRKLPYCDIRITNEKGELLAVMTGLAYRTSKEFPFEGLM